MGLPLGGGRSRATGGEPAAGATLADGIAVKRPGGVMPPPLRRFLDGVLVDESEIAAAMTHLAEHEKLVTEGAGAVAVAALLAGKPPRSRAKTVAILSGGNVDLGTLEGLLRRHEALAGRRLVLFTRIDDRPGGLAGLVSMLASTGANVVEVTHVRDGLDLEVRETGLQVVLQTHGQVHAESVTRGVAAADTSWSRSLGPPAAPVDVRTTGPEAGGSPSGDPGDHPTRRALLGGLRARCSLRDVLGESSRAVSHLLGDSVPREGSRRRTRRGVPAAAEQRRSRKDESAAHTVRSLHRVGGARRSSLVQTFTASPTLVVHSRALAGLPSRRSVNLPRSVPPLTTAEPARFLLAWP